MTHLVCALLLATAVASVGIAQEKKSSEYVESTGFKGKVFELKHRDPSEIYQSLSPLGSGFKGATMTVNNEMRTITVRDFPENLAVIEEALKRLDTPKVGRSEANIELTMHVLLANKFESGSRLPGEVPNDLKDVVKQLQNNFNFKNYHLAASIVQRAKSHNRYQGGNAIVGQGEAQWPEIIKDSEGRDKVVTGSSSYQYHAMEISISTTPNSPMAIELHNFNFTFSKTNIQTNLDIRDGEKLVVGTASFGDKAMILVLTAKVVK